MKLHEQTWVDKLPPAKMGDWDKRFLRLTIDSPVICGNEQKPSLIVAGSIVQIMNRTSVKRVSCWNGSLMPPECENNPDAKLLDVQWLCTHCEAPRREYHPQWWVDQRKLIFIEPDPNAKLIPQNQSIITNDDGCWVEKLPPARKGDWDGRYLRLMANSTVTYGWHEKRPSLLIADSIVQIVRRTSVKQNSHGSLPVPPECKGLSDAKLFDVKWLCPLCGVAHRELLPQSWVDDRKAIFVERDPLAMAA